MPAQRSMWKRSTPPARPPEPNSDAPTLAESGPISPSPGRAHVSQTRTGATWVGIVIGVLVLVLLIVFLLQNTVSVHVAFLGLQGAAPLAVMLLIAGVGFAIVTLVVGSLRMGQLRRRISREGSASTTR